MRVNVDLTKIEYNITKAQNLVNVPISLMFKDYYENILPRLSYQCKEKVHEIFATKAEGSVCYSIGKGNWHHKGALVIDEWSATHYYMMNIRLFYIPVNADDDREGLSIQRANQLARGITTSMKDVKVKALITSGCLNEKHPSEDQLEKIWESLVCFDSISLGGSFWLGKGKMLDFVEDIRIGEYMLFGTIPYNEDRSLLGRNAIEVESKIIGLFPERNEFIIDCGYSLADTKDCKPITNIDIEYVDSSSEYTIYRSEDVNSLMLGDSFTLIPNYKSLVKLRNAEYRFRKS